MKTTFENLYPDGTPRVMLGYWRPQRADAMDAWRSVWSYGDGAMNFEYSDWELPIYQVDDGEKHTPLPRCRLTGQLECPRRLRHRLDTDRLEARHANCPIEARARLDEDIARHRRWLEKGTGDVASR